ncbi:MAG: type IV toxin-antitoxin system AbiEi family antitoxin [Bacteroidales bacterium]|nr:type IV toxin-antitoxin system AbiEi family antitoxin [Bacteroidales bacterium]
MTDGLNITVRTWIENLEQRGRISFSLDHLAEENPEISEAAIKSALLRLSKKGKIVSIHKGFYLIISSEYALRGIIPPIQFIDDLMKFLNRPYYVGTISAAALFGAAHQAPQEFFVITGYPVMRSTAKKGIKINYISKRTLPAKLLKERKTQSGYVKISSEVLTAIDLVQYQNRSGGLSRVATVVNELMEEISPESFSQDLFASSTTTAIQRLGYLLEYELNNQLLADSLYKRSMKYGSKFQRIPLRQSVPFNGSSSENRWRVAKNIEIEIDE